MNIHEYQAKQLLKKYELPFQKGEVASTPEEALSVAKRMGGNAFVIKAQVHAGGRGKAGGVKFVNSAEAVAEVAKNLLGKRLVTFQTDEQGQPVNSIFIAEPLDIVREFYLGAVVDRASARVVFMFSTEGGVEIEKVAAEHPEKIIKIVMDPLIGIQAYQVREVGFQLNLNLDQIGQLTRMVIQLGRLFIESDLSLLEINPLVLTPEGKLVCLDAKINIDDNALYRQPILRAMHDSTQEDSREDQARKAELNYVALNGNIGCMVNGAGLAMATMDIIKLYGGEPANFLDVGGGATKERVAEAFKIILSDKKVRGILINIFGGIVRCDMIAEGIIAAVSEAEVNVPVVVRLEGNNAELGLDRLSKSGLNVTPAKGLANAAEVIVNAVQR